MAYRLMSQPGRYDVASSLKDLKLYIGVNGEDPQVIPALLLQRGAVSLHWPLTGRIP